MCLILLKQEIESYADCSIRLKNNKEFFLGIKTNYEALFTNLVMHFSIVYNISCKTFRAARIGRANEAPTGQWNGFSVLQLFHRERNR